MLGVRPLLGRLFTADEDRAGAAGTALLAHGTWLRRYGGDPAAVGRSLIVNGTSYRIVEVLPVSFTLRRDVLPTLGGAEQAELLLPLPLAARASTVVPRCVAWRPSVRSGDVGAGAGEVRGAYIAGRLVVGLVKFNKPMRSKSSAASSIFGPSASRRWSSGSSNRSRSISSVSKSKRAFRFRRACGSFPVVIHGL
jgi:hypothetical protein